MFRYQSSQNVFPVFHIIKSNQSQPVILHSHAGFIIKFMTVHPPSVDEETLSREVENARFALYGDTEMIIRARNPHLRQFLYHELH